MIRFIQAMIVAVVVMAMAFVPVLMPQVVRAQANEQALCEGSGGTYAGGKCTTPDRRTIGGTFKQVANILTFLVGAVAVLMLIIGGLRYVMSGGEQANITQAKNTILYAIVGIVVASLAYAAVNYVLGNLGA